MPDRKEILEVAGRPVAITNPDKVFFPAAGVTKLDMVRYYLSVADGALRGVARRPMVEISSPYTSTRPRSGGVNASA